MPISPPEHDLDAEVRRSGVISRLAKLPPFHPASARLIALSAQADAAFDDFERVFGSDPALASDLLVMANSPLYGLRTHIKHVRHGIVLLGLESVRSLAVTLAMDSYVHTNPARQVVQLVWRHSLAAALIAEALGTARGEPTAPLYTAGLLHDIGRLGLLNLEGDRYGEVMQRDYFDFMESMLLESFMFGSPHDDIGAHLTRSWGFPDSICECVRFHHDTHIKQGWTLRAIQIACQYAAALGFAELQCATCPAEPGDVLPDEFRHVPQLQPEQMRKRIEQAEAELSGRRAHAPSARTAAPARPPH